MNITPEIPAIRFRRSFFWYYLSDELFYTQKMQDKLFESLITSYHESTIMQMNCSENDHELNLDVFISSAGLVSYGRMDLLKDVFDNYPLSTKSPILKGIFSLLLMLFPMPVELRMLNKSRENIHMIKEWLEKNSSKLQWSEELGQYMFNLENQESVDDS
jgi:hypothetical protein